MWITDSRSWLLGIGLSIACFGVSAQQTPDAGALMRETERHVVPESLTSPSVPTAPTTPADSDAKRRVRVEQFRFTGTTAFKDSELQTALSVYTGRELSFFELQRAADAITEFYRHHGRFARAYLPEQDIRNGVVTIAVNEGRFGRILLEQTVPAPRLKSRVIEGMLGIEQHTGDPLQLKEVERGVRLLNDLPGVDAAAMLQAGAQPGDIDILARIQDKDLLAGSAQIDNFGARTTGYERATGVVYANNPTGNGDQISLMLNGSSGLVYARGGYQLPVGYRGLQVGVHASALNYELGDEFSALQARGTATTWAITSNYPVIRAATYNLTWHGGYENRDYRNKSTGIEISDKEVHAINVEVSGDRADHFALGGYFLASLGLTVGKLDLSGNTADLAVDQAGPRRDGDYTKLAWKLGRLQRLSAKNALWLSFSGQIADGNLDSSEKMSLGGQAGVRAYPVLEASGDEAWLFTVELRHNLRRDIQILGFYDAGGVVLHHDTWVSWNAANPNLPNRYRLSGLGAGLAWAKPGNFAVRVSAANRLASNPGADANMADHDGTRRHTRVWASGIKYF